MYSVDYTNRFKKDLKRCVKRGLDIGKIIEAVKLLEANGQLPTKYKPHKLVGDRQLPCGLFFILRRITGICAYHFRYL